MQHLTSKRTAINGKQGKLPPLYNKISFPEGSIVVDYGCGDVVNKMKSKAEENGAIWYGYDLYNQPEDVNAESLEILNKGVDYAISCNLLNVIDDDETLINIIHTLLNSAKHVIIQIWEGDGKGIGKPDEKRDSYQRNEKKGWYKDLIISLGYNATTKNGLIFANK